MYEFSVVNIITTSTARITRHATGSDYLFLMRAAFAVKMPKIAAQEHQNASHFLYSKIKNFDVKWAFCQKTKLLNNFFQKRDLI